MNKHVSTQKESTKKESFLLPDDQPEIKKEVLKEADRKKKKRQQIIKKYVIGLSVMLFISILLFGFGLIWQADTSLMAIGDALWLVFTLQMFGAWIIFVYNRNVLSPLIYSTKAFFLMFTGKKPKLDYYHYMKKVEDEQIPSFFIKLAFLTAFIVFIPTIIIFLILI